PFTCDTTGNIRFVDYQNGSNSNNGKTSATAWKTLNYAADQMKPGDFLYLMGGTYSEYDFGIGSGIGEGAVRFPGTDSERITMTSYPGAKDVVVSTEIGAKSSYWTFTNITFVGTAGTYAPLSLGHRYGWQPVSIFGVPEGVSSIGNEFTGTMWLALEAYGNNITIQGNYIKFTPDPSTLHGSAYSLYMGSGTNRVIKDNEIHGGSKWLIHYYDEKRTSTETYKEVSGVIDGNWFDATNNGGIGLRGAIIFQLSDNGTPPVTIEMKSMTVKNNIFFTRDAGLINDWSMVMLRGNSKNIKIYNNTFYNINTSAIAITTTKGTENFEIRNNIFADIDGYDIDASGNPQSVTASSNLYDNTPNLNSITDTNPIVGDPQFVNPAGYDFHLKSTSPAIDAGLTIDTVIRDYEYNPRPLDGDYSGTPEYDVGAFEYAD
ncbi:hypothetical protein MNBD_BACTEROID07-431, partial [hydrothermal vent metagenome]